MPQVGETLAGKSKGTFESVANVVQNSVEASLTEILSPKRRVDILRDVIACKAEKRPYTIVFCGVNGVGKSTNLAKVCVMNNFKPPFFPWLRCSQLMRNMDASQIESGAIHT